MTKEPNRWQNLSRREMCRALFSTCTLPVLGLPLAACGGTSSVNFVSVDGGRDAAILLPLSGAASELGQNMGRAASLVTQGLPDTQAPRVYDTTDTPAGAASAARQALDQGARMLLGPLRSDQTPAVLEVAGNVPVVTFSNDDALTQRGAFVMGITPAQSVAAIFSYARAQGISRIALVARDGPLGAASARAAQGLAAAGGITLSTVLRGDATAGGLVDAIRSASAGRLPEAVFLPEGGATLTSFSRALSGSGLQILGSVQWGVQEVTENSNLDGAWFAAPPPDLFLPFADRYAAAFGTQPGVITALGHDAALMAVGLGNARALSRQGLLRKAGFTGVLGAFRFGEDGRCQRDLAVLSIRQGGIVALGEVEGT